MQILPDQTRTFHAELCRLAAESKEFPSADAVLNKLTVGENQGELCIAATGQKQL